MVVDLIQFVQQLTHSFLLCAYIGCFPSQMACLQQTLLVVRVQLLTNIRNGCQLHVDLSILSNLQSHFHAQFWWWWWWLWWCFPLPELLNISHRFCCFLVCLWTFIFIKFQLVHFFWIFFSFSFFSFPLFAHKPNIQASIRHYQSRLEP